MRRALARGCALSLNMSRGPGKAGAAHFARACRARSRRPTKQASPATGAACAAAPSSIRSRRRCRSWSARISSWTYSPLVAYPRVATCSSTKDFSESGSDKFIVPKNYAVRRHLASCEKDSNDAPLAQTLIRRANSRTGALWPAPSPARRSEALNRRPP
jgi:hypothetical protein